MRCVVVNPNWIIPRWLRNAIRVWIQRRAPIAQRDQWFWKQSWQRGEHNVDADLRAGRYDDFHSIEELLKVLPPPPQTEPLSPAMLIAQALRRFRRAGRHNRRSQAAP